MRTKQLLFFTFIVLLFSCNNKKPENMSKKDKAIFLHHSTGTTVWRGTVSKISWKLFKEGNLQKWIKKYNKKNGANYSIEEMAFPKKAPYGWRNYPYDYYNIWVKNAGEKPYMEEPTLEMLTKEYGLIIWKHCYPVSDISEDIGSPDIEAEEHRLENYKLQYEALKEKMLEFPETKFLVWTGATHAEVNTTEEKAKRMKEFTNWVRNDWDKKGDNIFLWDFYELETEGGLYLKNENMLREGDSHPNRPFAESLIPMFGKRIVDVFTNKADESNITGK